MSLKGKAAIIGFAEMAPQKKSGSMDPLTIVNELARAAIVDAGLEKKDIDGLLTCVHLSSEYSNTWKYILPDSIHLQMRYFEQVPLSGASGAGMVWRAAASIDTGMCNYVLCVIGESYDSKTFVAPRPRIQEEFDVPYAMIGANANYALIARRHMYEFGTTAEQMAKVAVDQRKNACKNPMALFGDSEITIDDVLNSPMIVDPLHLLEIVRPCTGGGAFIVTSAERAKRSPNRAVYLLGAGEAGGHTSIIYAPSLTTSLVKPAAESAFKMAGVSPQDMTFVQPYDCYPIAVIITLEDAGFCRKGEGGRFVAEHDLSYKGDFPCNTHGGQLSFGQPGNAGGMSHVIEAVRQLMGRGDGRQVDGATIGYVNGNGGIMSWECSLVLGIE
jgi:acetyl-CoA C-acetyltransferase